MIDRARLEAARRPVDDRAVSDVVGYVLVFTLITATLVTVFAVGFAGLEDRQNAERVANVERAVDVFDDNLRDLQRYEDPSRSTEIRLSGGTLSLETGTTMTLEYENESGTFEYRSVSMSTLTYTSRDTTIAYEGGGWFRVDGDRATMRSPPRFVAEDGRTVLPVVRLLPGSDAEPIRTDGTVQVSTVWSGSSTRQYPETDPETEETVRLRIESPYADAWAAYLEEKAGFTGVSRSDEAVVATIENDEAVFLRTIGVRVSLRE